MSLWNGELRPKNQDRSPTITRSSCSSIFWRIWFIYYIHTFEHILRDIMIDQQVAILIWFLFVYYLFACRSEASRKFRITIFWHESGACKDSEAPKKKQQTIWFYDFNRAKIITKNYSSLAITSCLRMLYKSDELSINFQSMQV